MILDISNKIQRRFEALRVSRLQNLHRICRESAETQDVLQSVLEAGRSGLDGIRDLVHQRFASKARHVVSMCFDWMGCLGCLALESLESPGTDSPGFPEIGCVCLVSVVLRPKEDFIQMCPRNLSDLKDLNELRRFM